MDTLHIYTLLGLLIVEPEQYDTVKIKLRKIK